MSALRRLSVNRLVPRRRGPGAQIARRTRVVLFLMLSAANTFGAVVVFALSVWALPAPEVADETEAQIVNLIAACAYVVAATVIGTMWSLRRLRPVYEWLNSEREPTADERDAVLRAPRRVVAIHIWLWALAAIAFGVLNLALYNGELGRRVALTVALGGATTCAIVYLFCERGLRAAAARALSAGPPERPRAPGVRARTFLGWSLGTGVPVIGLMIAALSALIDDDYTLDDLAITVLALGGVALAAGFYLSRLTARAVADPIREVREALAEVERGDLDVEVSVYDGSELGQLQAGFNRMAAGLRERARIHDLFGRHVGEDVARAALEQGVELGGEMRDVAVLFTDVVGSTRLASELPPHEVVERLNAFFGVVIEVVGHHGGSVNKFEGDAVLAIFGAPDNLDDASGRALAAARELAERLPGEVDGVRAGVGVSAGKVVAGNIGGESRFEYTVIGDPVNEAARLSELAKERAGSVLASETAVEGAGDDEAERWELGESVELAGRQRPTRLAAPR